MTNTPDSDLYPTISYIDPLTMPEYIKTNSFNSIRQQVYGDWLLSSFITKLDMEIVDDVEEFKEKKELILEIFDATRMYGWCVYQPYSEIDKVFTPINWERWITTTNKETKKLEKIGLKVKWEDELGNTWNDELYFESKEGVSKAYLFIWKKGNGITMRGCPKDSDFALPDLDLSVLSLAIQIRQIQSAMTRSATNPFFYHVKYGQSITPAQRQTLINQMAYASASMGVGAKEGVLKEIVSVENGSIEKSLIAMKELISFYAATTRLPLSFYFGERQSGGGLNGDRVEEADTGRLYRKKEYILQHFLKQLTEIAQEEWGITLPNLYNFYKEKREDDIDARRENTNKTGDDTRTVSNETKGNTNTKDNSS